MLQLPVDTLSTVNSLSDLDAFLRQVEKRAYAIAFSAVGHREEALDIVQDSMLKLARLYGTKDESDWQRLFPKILQSRIRDWYRRRKVKNALFGFLPRMQDNYKDEQEAPLDNIPATATHSPDQLLSQFQTMEQLSEVLRQLPGRQREVFYLRCWDGLNVADTANALGITSGSVKTHYSRALQTIRTYLEHNDG